MNNQNVELDQLFARAREQAPEISFEDTKKRFLGSLVLAAGGTLATKGIIHLFTKKWIIMMTIITVATSAAIVAGTISYGDDNNNEPIVTKIIPPVELKDDEPVIEPEPEQEVVQPMEYQEDTTPNNIVEKLPQNDTEQISIGEPIVNWNSCKEYAFVPPDSLEKKKEKIIPYSERFVVTQNTTKDQLEEIKQEAENAGIAYDYTAEYKKGKLDQLTISMSLTYENGDRNANMNETRTITDITKKDKIVIAWIEDQEGKAMIIGDEDDWDCDFDLGDMEEYEEYMKDFEKCMQEFEMSMKELDQINYAFVDESGVYVFNSDCNSWCNDMEIVMPEMPELPELEIQLELEQLEEELEELDELNDEMIEEIEEKMEVLEEKLEELEERLEERKEELRENRERDLEREKEKEREREREHERDREEEE
mgnify:CR=1 FL=1